MIGPCFLRLKTPRSSGALDRSRARFVAMVEFQKIWEQKTGGDHIKKRPNIMGFLVRALDRVAPNFKQAPMWRPTGASSSATDSLKAAQEPNRALRRVLRRRVKGVRHGASID